MNNIVKCGLALLALITCSILFFSWATFDVRQIDVDIRTGRIRTSQHSGFNGASEHIEESPLSEALPRGVVDGATPEWHPVSRFTSGARFSPHYRFHAATSQIRNLALIWEMSGADRAAKEKMALHVLALWQHAGTDTFADNYLSSFAEIIGEKDKREQILRTVRDLEMPLDRVEGDLTIRTVSYPDGTPMERLQGHIDPSGRFARDGTWETWHSNGRRAVYGHIKDGAHHGRRFEWDREGRLSVIEKFEHDELIECESSNLENHPSYQAARALQNSPQ